MRKTARPGIIVLVALAAALLWPAPASANPPPPLTGVVAIATGGEHTCAVTAGGAVKCWGENADGQLGDGTTINRTIAIDVMGLGSGGAAVSASDELYNFDHTCALTDSGSVKCWGSNFSGQLGDGSTTDHTTAVDVSGLSGVTEVAAGGVHTCALTTAGGVKCWGDNRTGTVGGGTETCAHPSAGWGSCSTSPVDVAGVTSSVVGIEAGFAHTCAVTSEGGVKCWGDNTFGQLGDGTTDYRGVALDVSGLSSGVQAVSAGLQHTCALTTEGGVKCWGDNYYGQLGAESSDTCLLGTSCSTTPLDVTGLASGVAAVSAGGRHTCALTTAGGVKCWGGNGSGQLGDGTFLGRATPVDVCTDWDCAEYLSDIAAVAAGGYHTCALTAAGGVKCWGRNDDGQLGDNTTTGATMPVDVLVDSDSDGDGCSGLTELGYNPSQGGQRDPKSYWDFFDTPDPNASPQRDRMIRINDVVRVLNRYGTDDDEGTADINRNTDPLSTPPETGYHPAYDRGEVVGPDPWDLGPPDGMIRVGDIVAVLNQYGHDCV